MTVRPRRFGVALSAFGIAAPLLASATPARADALPALDTVVTPDSPAFVQIGVSPTQIQRPTDPRAFAAAIVPAVLTQNGFGIPASFALEAAPYWWQSHPTLRREEFQRGNLGAIYRNFSLSIASTLATGGTPSASASASTSTSASAPGPVPKAAFGMHTTLWHGTPSDEAECQAQLAKEGALYHAAMEAAVLKNPTPTPDELKKMDRDATAAVNAADAPCVNAWSVHRTFVLDAAAALSLAMPDNTFDHAKVSGYSGWLTGAAVPVADLSLMLLARYFADGIEGPSEQRTLDGGGRATYTWDRFGVGLEGLYRGYLTGSARDHKYAIRLTLTLDVMLSERLWLTVTAGRDYAPLGADPLLSLAGLKWNIDTGSARTVYFDKDNPLPTVSVPVAAPGLAAAPAIPPTSLAAPPLSAAP